MMDRRALIINFASLQGITQTQLSQWIDVKQSSVSRASGGLKSVSLDKFAIICSRLGIDPDFLHDKSDYPFIPHTFLKFSIGGVKHSLQPFSWLKLLLNYSQKLTILLLLQKKNDRVEAVCMKDHRGTVFFVTITTKIYMQDFFDFFKNRPQDGITLLAKPFFDNKSAGLYRTASDIASFDRSSIDKLIKTALLDILTEEERTLIKTIRESGVPIVDILQSIKKKKS
jgi:hypothetical protein